MRIYVTMAAALLGPCIANAQSPAASPPPSAPPLRAHLPPPPLPRPRPPSPCAAPPGTAYERPPPPIRQTLISAPKRAVTEHVHGCAGIRLHIAPDGSPHDITVVADLPPGYGFGEAAKQAAANMMWAPRNDSAWQYIVFNEGPPPRR